MSDSARAPAWERIPGGEATFRLLDADPDLAAALPPGEVRVARCAVRAFHRLLPEGAWAGISAEVPGAVVGLILDGFLLRRSTVAGRTAAEILGPGDVVVSCPNEAGTPGTLSARGGAIVSWSVLATCGLAILDAAAMRRASRWPEVTTTLLRRVGARASRLAQEDAVRRAPRIEERLLALFAELAGRWGRVTPAGVLIDVPLTHEVLSQLAGARRPTVSTALKELRRRGILSRRSDRRWVLAGDPMGPAVAGPGALRARRPRGKSAPRAGSHLAPAGTVR